MSFSGYKEHIDYGDTVIIYMGFESMLQFEVENGKVHQTKFGAIRHDSLVGVAFGSKLKCTKGYVHVLHPTPELWTVNLPHRTQILYATDISVITLQLELKPGSVVVEAGTGSASLSHSIIRTIAPNGHLYTFDFHALRVEKARDEFQRHGLSKMVTAAHGDVCKEGFGLDEEIADAVFLDLPSPWEAIPFAKNVLLPGGRFCSFSPCIEQVQRTCDVLTDVGFTDLHTMECLLQPIDVRTMVVPMPDLGYGAGKSYVSTPLTSEGLSSGPRVDDDKPVLGHVEISDGNEMKNTKFKKRKLIKGESEIGLETGEASNDDDGEIEVDAAVESVASQGESDKIQRQNTKRKASFVFKSGMSALQIPGHTGYLTFATLYP